jgi:predicted Zn-ribbon and HTH transcriptional regulator
MPAKSQSQRGLIFSKRKKYGSESDTPKKWKWIWEEGWENKGKLPKKVKKKKKNENTIILFTEFLNEGVVVKRLAKCNDCGYVGNEFEEFSRPFRRRDKCPKCKSKNVDDDYTPPKPQIAPAPLRIR